MKRSGLLLLSFLISAYGSWESLGPDGGSIRCVVMSPLNENNLYATTYTAPTKFYRSTDAGATWTKTSSVNLYPACLEIDNNNNLYLGAGSIYKSTNGGLSWTNYAPGGSVNDLVPHPFISTTIYAAGTKSVAPYTQITFYKSTNSGVNWTSTAIAVGKNHTGQTIAVDPTDGNVIYVGGNSYDSTLSRFEPRIYKSTDGGASFAQVFADNLGMYVFSIAVHPTNPDIICAGTLNDGIWRSTDAGATWTRISTLANSFIMKTSAANPDFILVGANTAVYRSTDAGITWTQHTSGVKGSGFYGLALSQSNPAIAYTSDNAGIFKTTDMAQTWSMSHAGITAGLILDFGIAPSQPATIYTEFENVGVYKTLNAGTTWTLMPTPSTCGALSSFVVNRHNPDEVYALEGSG